MKTISLLVVITIIIFVSCSTSRGSLYKDVVEKEKKESEIGKKDSDEDAAETSETTGLEIISYPDNGEVLLDNRFVGVTPLLLSDLEAGRYKLTIRKEGYYTHTSWINYYQDYLLYEAELEPITGFLKIKTSPSQAQILVGSESLTSGSTHEIPVGYYTLQVRAFGYEDYYAGVEIVESSLTALEVNLQKADFDLYDLSLSRRVFNPRNAGLLGMTRIYFEVSSFGTGRATILNSRNQEVFSESFAPFQTWEQGFDWEGRSSSGAPLPDGKYTILIEAVSQEGPVGPESGESLSREISVHIDSTILLTYRSLWSGSSGLLYAASPEVLPHGSLQLSSLVLAHVELGEDEFSFTIPWNIALRVGLMNNLEVDAAAGVIIGHYQDAAEAADFIPYFGSASLKAALLKPKGSIGLGSAASLKLSYQNVHTDTLANFTGLSLGLPTALWLGPLGVLLTPEIILSYTSISYDPEEDPASGFYSWAYGRTGLILNIDPISLGVSTTFRTKPFNQGFGIDLPLQAGAEVHWLIPGTQLFLSFLLAVEFRRADDFYLLGGGGLGLLD